MLNMIMHSVLSTTLNLKDAIPNQDTQMMMSYGCTHTVHKDTDPQGYDPHMCMCLNGVCS